MRNESREFAYVLMERIGRPKHIVEVGAFKSDHIVSLPFIYDRKCRIQLIEPNPHSLAELQQAFSGFSNVKIHGCAIAESDGELTLLVPRVEEGNPDAEASAFVSALPSSPYMRRKACGPTEDVTPVVVPAVTFDKFDDGTIEGLMVDTEGAEWYVIQRLLSRPSVICVEMEGPCGYKNPNFEKITEWMRSENYRLNSIERVSRPEGEVPTDYVYTRDAS
jgi:FkbM family methyltransferase